MQTASRITVRPEISKVEDAKSITAYCHYLVMKVQVVGNLCFDGHRQSNEEIQIAEQCQMLCSSTSGKEYNY